MLILQLDRELAERLSLALQMYRDALDRTDRCEVDREVFTCLRGSADTNGLTINPPKC